MASVAASEKFRTDVTDIRVEAKQRLRDFKRDQRGAIWGDWNDGGATTASKGGVDIMNSSTGAST